MRLIDYLKLHGITDKGFADQVGGVSEGAVKKWKYGERTPRLPEIIRIEEITKGVVTPSDFVGDASNGAAA